MKSSIFSFILVYVSLGIAALFSGPLGKILTHPHPAYYQQLTEQTIRPLSYRSSGLINHRAKCPTWPSRHHSHSDAIAKSRRVSATIHTVSGGNVMK